MNPAEQKTAKRVRPAAPQRASARGCESADVSVVIVNWNTRELLGQALRAVQVSLEHSSSFRGEIVVVDNGSKDGSVEMLREEFPGVRLIANGDNRGFAIANNQAIEASLGKYVLLVNSDCFVEENTVAEMRQFMEEHDDAGVVGCKLVRPWGETQLSFAQFPSLMSVLFGSPFARECSNARKAKNEPASAVRVQKEVDWVAGACMMVRRAAIEDAGPLDEAFFMYGEEVEWCYRIKRRGWKVFYIRPPAAVHIGQASGSGSSCTRLNSMSRLFAKHHGNVYAAALRPVVFVASSVRLLIWSVAKFVFPSKRVRAQQATEWHVTAIRWSLRPNYTPTAARQE